MLHPLSIDAMTEIGKDTPLAPWPIFKKDEKLQVEVLERKYGGRLRANRAARTIQRAYRRYKMNDTW